MGRAAAVHVELLPKQWGWPPSAPTLLFFRLSSRSRTSPSAPRCRPARRAAGADRGRTISSRRGTRPSSRPSFCARRWQPSQSVIRSRPGSSSPSVAWVRWWRADAGLGSAALDLTRGRERQLRLRPPSPVPRRLVGGRAEPEERPVGLGRELAARVRRAAVAPALERRRRLGLELVLPSRRLSLRRLGRAEQRRRLPPRPQHVLQRLLSVSSAHPPTSVPGCAPAAWAAPTSR